MKAEGERQNDVVGICYCGQSTRFHLTIGLIQHQIDKQKKNKIKLIYTVHTFTRTAPQNNISFKFRYGFRIN